MFVVDGCPTPSNCNCDIIDGIPRSDNGTIMDKQFLPVSELHFKANADQNSVGMVDIGSLNCNGIGKAWAKYFKVNSTITSLYV